MLNCLTGYRTFHQSIAVMDAHDTTARAPQFSLNSTICYVGADLFTSARHGRTLVPNCDLNVFSELSDASVHLIARVVLVRIRPRNSILPFDLRRSDHRDPGSEPQNASCRAAALGSEARRHLRGLVGTSSTSQGTGPVSSMLGRVARV